MPNSKQTIEYHTHKTCFGMQNDKKNQNLSYEDDPSIKPSINNYHILKEKAL